MGGFQGLGFTVLGGKCEGSMRPDQADTDLRIWVFGFGSPPVGGAGASRASQRTQYGLGFRVYYPLNSGICLKL